ncbi:hypothetical protein DYQ86_16830 [Acidobacteria bacterium AB60]|nr:hypothetical protein DYQ86_16830 [Acidobacteria bacterium AB60]
MKHTLGIFARRAAPALALLWALHATAQNAAPVGGGFRIAGRVVNAATGDPIPRVTVAAHSQPDGRVLATAVSDSDGHFSIENLAAAKYPLSASKRGFRTEFYDEHEEFNSAIVTGEGQDTEHLQFSLAPPASLHGIVTGDGGDPVEGANVMLFRMPDAAHRSEGIVHMDNAMTDDTGAYQFSDLPAGRYYLAVKADPWYALHGRANRNVDGSPTGLDVAYPVTFFDSSIDESSAVPIALAEGSREEANVNLHAVPAIHLKLPETARSRGTPSVVLRETVFGQEMQGRGGLVAIQPGNLEAIGVAPGHYQITHGEPPRTVELNATSDVEIEPDAGVAAVTLSGTLHTSAGLPIEEDINLLLEPAEGTGRMRMQTFAQKGQFTFEGVLPGRWNLTAYAGPDGLALPVVSIATGQHAVAGNEIAVGDHSVSVAVAVSRSQTRIEGLARLDGKPASGAMIVLVPRAPGAYLSLLRRDQSDSDGSFALHDVAPGQYTVVAIVDGWKLDWRDREAIAPYLAAGTAVTIRDRSAPVVQLTKPLTAIARGTGASGGADGR